MLQNSLVDPQTLAIVLDEEGMKKNKTGKNEECLVGMDISKLSKVFISMILSFLVFNEKIHQFW